MGCSARRSRGPRATPQTHRQQGGRLDPLGACHRTGRLTSPHVGFLPLPYVGHPHADGSIKGIALPRSHRGVSAKERSDLPGAIWEKNRGRNRSSGAYITTLGARGTVRIRRIEHGAKLVHPVGAPGPSLSKVWVTATPIVLDRFPRRSPRARSRKGDGGVRGRGADGGPRLRGHRPPRPAHVRLLGSPHLQGSLDATVGRVETGCYAGCRHAMIAFVTSRSPGRSSSARTLRRPRPLCAGRGERVMLTIDDFLLCAVHGNTLPWQERLMREVVTREVAAAARFADRLGQDRGDGCCGVPHGPRRADQIGERNASRRVVFVVDRRVVVDQAYVRARKLVDAALKPSSVPQVVRQVAGGQAAQRRKGSSR